MTLRQQVLTNALLTPSAEKIFEQLAGTLLINAAQHLRHMVAGRLLKETTTMFYAATLGIIGGKNKPSYPRQADCPRAHGTGFEGHIEIAFR